jgi:hypothetical protein
MGGAARTAHMRSHVRAGEAIEEKKNGKLVFLAADEEGGYSEPEPYAKLGEETESHQPAGVWDMTEDLEALPSIDPKEYYITSGEATKKVEKLIADSYSLAVRARTMQKKLTTAKGSAKYLETQRENGRLLVKCKSPRKKE